MAAANTLKVVLEGVDKVSGTVTGIENRFKKLQKVMTAVIAVGTAQKFADMAVEGAKFRAQLKGIGGDGLKVQKELLVIIKENKKVLRTISLFQN